MASEAYYEKRTTIRRSADFDALWADSGPGVELEAPNSTDKIKFKAAIEQIGDDEMSDIRAFDRSRSGGFVNG
jgi:hypothetical protein